LFLGAVYKLFYLLIYLLSFTTLALFFTRAKHLRSRVALDLHDDTVLSKITADAIFGVVNEPRLFNAHVNTSLHRPPDRTWRRPPGRPRNKWLDQLRNDSTLETSGGVLSTVDMVVQRRDGPRRLRDDDDSKIVPSIPWVRNT